MKRPRPLLAVGLLLCAAGCGLRPTTYTRWVPGMYQYRSTLTGTGDVSGSIEVGSEGVVSVTSNLGPCERRFERARGLAPTREEPGAWAPGAFVCGTEHQVNVWLGYRGGPPIRGEISNQRTVTETYYAETTCREYRTTDTGERICLVWNVEPKTERRTTGAAAPFYLLPDSAGAGP